MGRSAQGDAATPGCRDNTASWKLRSQHPLVSPAAADAHASPALTGRSCRGRSLASHDTAMPSRDMASSRACVRADASWRAAWRRGSGEGGSVESAARSVTASRHGPGPLFSNTGGCHFIRALLRICLGAHLRRVCLKHDAAHKRVPPVPVEVGVDLLVFWKAPRRATAVSAIRTLASAADCTRGAPKRKCYTQATPAAARTSQLLCFQASKGMAKGRPRAFAAAFQSSFDSVLRCGRCRTNVTCGRGPAGQAASSTSGAARAGGARKSRSWISAARLAAGERAHLDAPPLALYARDLGEGDGEGQQLALLQRFSVQQQAAGAVHAAPARLAAAALGRRRGALAAGAAAVRQLVQEGQRLAGRARRALLPHASHVEQRALVEELAAALIRGVAGRGQLQRVGGEEQQEGPTAGRLAGGGVPVNEFFAAVVHQPHHARPEPVQGRPDRHGACVREGRGRAGAAVAAAAAAGEGGRQRVAQRKPAATCGVCTTSRSALCQQWAARKGQKAGGAQTGAPLLSGSPCMPIEEVQFRSNERRHHPQPGGSAARSPPPPPRPAAVDSREKG